MCDKDLDLFEKTFVEFKARQTALVCRIGERVVFCFVLFRCSSYLPARFTGCKSSPLIGSVIVQAERGTAAVVALDSTFKTLDDVVKANGDQLAEYNKLENILKHIEKEAIETKAMTPALVEAVTLHQHNLEGVKLSLDTIRQKKARTGSLFLSLVLGHVNVRLWKVSRTCFGFGSVRRSVILQASRCNVTIVRVIIPLLYVCMHVCVCVCVCVCVSDDAVKVLLSFSERRGACFSRRVQSFQAKHGHTIHFVSPVPTILAVANCWHVRIL
jgi:hypothetical protein